MAIHTVTNLSSLNAQRNLFNANAQLAKSLERLSSGYKINRASDGVAELVKSEFLRADIRGTTAAIQNAQEGLNVLNIADGGLQEISKHIQRARELAVLASNGTVTDFTAFNNEYQQVRSAIDAIATSVEFNNQVLLNGSVTSFTLQVGPRSGDSLALQSAFNVSSNATTLGLTTTTLSTSTDAGNVLTQVDTALNTLSSRIATVGGLQAQVQDRINYLSIAKENLSASEALVRNTDVAEETAKMTRLQVTQQAAAAALAQANQIPSIVLRLLQ